MSVFITPEIARQVAEILQKHMVGLAGVLYGQDALSPAEWQLAVDLGVIDPTAPPQTLASQMLAFGSMLAHLGDAQAHSRYGSTGEEWAEEVERHPIPWTPVEKKAAVIANTRAAQYVVGLGNKFGATLGSKLIEADQDLDREMRGTIRDVISARLGDDDAAQRIEERGVDKGLDDEFFDNSFRSTIERAASDLGHLTDDWSRNFRRIVFTESQRAFNEGMVVTWEEEQQQVAEEQERPVKRIHAYKIVKGDACQHCKRVYLEGGHPRIYSLDELTGNGDNVSRKAANWLAVVGPTHPHCGCALVRLPTYIELPEGWTSGQSAPAIVDSSGMLVLPE